MSTQREDQARQKKSTGRAQNLSRKKKALPKEAISRTTSLMAYLEQHRAEDDKQAKLKNIPSGDKSNNGHTPSTQPQETSTNSKKDDGDRAQRSLVGHEKVVPLSPSRQQIRVDVPLKNKTASKASAQIRRQTSNRDSAKDTGPRAEPLPSLVKKTPATKQNRQHVLLMLLLFFIASFVIFQIIWVETMMNPTGSSSERGASLEDGGILHHGVHNIMDTYDNFLRSKKTDELGPPDSLPSLPMAQHEKEIMKIAGNIRPLQNILIDAGHDNITREFLNQLPSPQEVESLYGSDAILYGSQTCDAFRSAVPEVDRFISPAGMFNTGTNLLMTLLQKNCYIKARTEKYGPETRGIRFQVPWGKHSPVGFRKHHKASDNLKVNEDDVLPVVVIKDPYTWMTSMCRHSYSANWWHNEDKHCPNLVPITPYEIKNFNNTNSSAASDTPGDTAPTIPAKVHYPKESPMTWRHHKSLLHIWTSYYQEYVDAMGKFPFLVVRFEDLLFRTKDIIEQVCECAGGTLESNFSYVTDSAKKGGSHAGSSGFASSLSRYGNATLRLEPFFTPDLKYAEKVLGPSEVMKLFQYKSIRPPKITEH